ncbi:DUF3455 domain-containing protein [Chitinimonas sp.]|uniref:DUF3455 domain-containing protein n=1 Tax=Chitinimonas sp. TaxID=1934313 RepID=UPI0035B0DB55
MKKLTLAAVATLVSLGAAAAGPVAIAVPDALKLPADQVLTLQLNATGFQIYDCKPSKADASKFEWTFRAPEADLFDAAGAKVGTHFAGPTWKSTDDSTVVGEVLAKDPGPDANSIPWLLLKAKSNSGNGVFGKVSSIHRLQTMAGKAPVDGCSADKAGAESRVPYKAVYNFYSAK